MFAVDEDEPAQQQKVSVCNCSRMPIVVVISAVVVLVSMGIGYIWRWHSLEKGRVRTLQLHVAQWTWKRAARRMAEELGDAVATDIAPQFLPLFQPASGKPIGEKPYEYPDFFHYFPDLPPEFQGDGTEVKELITDMYNDKHILRFANEIAIDERLCQMIKHVLFHRFMESVDWYTTTVKVDLDKCLQPIRAYLLQHHGLAFANSLNDRFILMIKPEKQEKYKDLKLFTLDDMVSLVWDITKPYYNMCTENRNRKSHCC